MYENVENAYKYNIVAMCTIYYTNLKCNNIIAVAAVV